MVSNQDASLVYFEGGPVLFTTKKTTTPPTKTIPSKNEQSEQELIAEWGEENDWPEKARIEKESNPDLASALDWKARALYAGGIDFKIIDRQTEEPADRSNEDVRKMAFAIEKFIYRNRHYPLQAGVDFYDLFNVFPQMIITDNRQELTHIAAMEARNCRFKKRDSKGKISHVYIHPDWAEWNSTEKDEKLQKSAMVDPLTASPEDIKNDKRGALKFIYPLGYPTGKNYYQLPHWWSVKVSKWLDFASMIPEVKESILRNLALIRYHIQMPDYWMPERYKKWSNMTDKERKDATQKEFKIVNDILSKPENAGKSVFTVFKTQVASGKEYGGWKIEAVDDKMKDGALLADSSEATIKVFSGTSIDPSLHGLIPGKGGSNRSGSDKREALNIYISLIQSHEDILLDPFQFAAWYNGWTNENFKTTFHFRKPMLQTLNQVTPAQRATTPDTDAD
mgnify:CR=1 FL=1